MLLLFYPQKSQLPPPLRFLRLIRCKDTKKSSNGCYLQEKRRKRLNFVAHLRNILSFCNRNKKKRRLWTYRRRGCSCISRGRGYKAGTRVPESYSSGIGRENGSAEGTGLPFRERQEHHTCFYDAYIPCAGCASGIGNERHRKGCAIIIIFVCKISVRSRRTVRPKRCGLSVRSGADSQSEGLRIISNRLHFEFYDTAPCTLKWKKNALSFCVSHVFFVTLWEFAGFL